MVADEKEQMIAKIREIADRRWTDLVPRNQFLRESGFSERAVIRAFGKYNGLVEAASLRKGKALPKAGEPRYSNDEMQAEVARVLRLPDAKLTRVFFEQHAQISTSAIERRFGGWIGALRSVRERLARPSDRNIVAKIDSYVSPTVPPASAESDATLTTGRPLDGGQEIEDANVYGDFINFRGLQHAPLNENGVVFLFGMICRELGYVVEIVKPGFPDCEAKRKIRGKESKWQQVRIEFEYQSRNFRSHGHNPTSATSSSAEHNWPDCPI